MVNIKTINRLLIGPVIHSTCCYAVTTAPCYDPLWQPTDASILQLFLCMYVVNHSIPAYQPHTYKHIHTPTSSMRLSIF